MRVAAGLTLVPALAACLGGGGPPPPDRCSLKVIALEKLESGPGSYDIEYRVGGEAGSRAKVWLAARVGDKRYLSGPGVRVGPGVFQAIVELDLTGRPLAFVAVLEVAGERCDADAEMPGG